MKRRALTDDELDRACEAIADFADIKSSYTVGHTPAVAAPGRGRRSPGRARGDRSGHAAPRGAPPRRRQGLDLGRIGAAVNNAPWRAPIRPEIHRRDDPGWLDGIELDRQSLKESAQLSHEIRRILGLAHADPVSPCRFVSCSRTTAHRPRSPPGALRSLELRDLGPRRIDELRVGIGVPGESPAAFDRLGEQNPRPAHQ